MYTDGYYSDEDFRTFCSGHQSGYAFDEAEDALRDMYALAV